MIAADGQPLYGCDLFTGHRFHGRLATADCLAVQMNGACATESQTATVFCPSKLKFVPEKPEQGHLGIPLKAARNAIDRELNHDGL
jgi:hypothetical protein